MLHKWVHAYYTLMYKYMHEWICECLYMNANLSMHVYEGTYFIEVYACMCVCLIGYDINFLDALQNIHFQDKNPFLITMVLNFIIMFSDFMILFS